MNKGISIKRMLSITTIAALLFVGLMPLLMLVPENSSAVDWPSGYTNSDGLATQFWDVEPNMDMGGQAENNLWRLVTNQDTSEQLWHTGNRCWWYGDLATGWYEVQKNGESVRTAGNLTLKANGEGVDLRGQESAFLSFHYNLQIETAGNPTGYEDAIVYTSTDNVNWVEISRLYDTRGEWEYKLIDIGHLVGQRTVYIRFFFDSKDGIDNRYRGWRLDDVMIFEKSDGFQLRQARQVVNTQINDLVANPSASRVVPLTYQGEIMFTSPGKRGGTDLGPLSSEFIVTPGSPVSISVWVQNMGTEFFPSLEYGIRIFNRFGIQIHSETMTFQLDPRSHHRPEITWTPVVSDQYLVVAYASTPGNPPPINPYSLAPIGGRLAYRPLKAYEALLDDPCDPYPESTNTDQSLEWVANPSSSINGGHFHIQGNKYYSASNSWRGGNFGYVSQSASYILTSNVVDASELFWVYRNEEYTYPNGLEQTGSGNMGLYLTFFYLFSMNPRGLGDSGQLQMRWTVNGNWQSWSRIWDTNDTDDPRNFNPNSKTTWTTDYNHSIPTRIDLTGYLPWPNYDPDFRIQFRFVVSSNWFFPSTGWYIDDIQLFAIIPEFNLGFTESNSPVIIPETGGTGTFQVYMSTSDCNVQGDVQLSVEQIFDERYIPINVTDRWTSSLSPQSAIVRGGALIPVSYSLTTNATPEPGIYGFRLKAAMIYYGMGEVAWSEIELYLKVGDRDIDLVAQPRVQEAGPGENITYNLTVTNNYIDQRTINISHMEGIPEDWEVYLDDEEIVLAGGYSATTAIHVRPPVNALVDDNFNITVFAWNADDRGDVVSANVHTWVKGVYKLQLSGDAERNAYPGSTISVPITVRNTGNLPGNVVLTLENTTLEEYSLSHSVIPNMVGYSTPFTVVLTATIPEDADNASYSITVRGVLAGEAVDLHTINFITAGPLIVMVPIANTTQAAVYSEAQEEYVKLYYRFEIYNNGTPLTNIDFVVTGNATAGGNSWVGDIDPVIGINETSVDNGKLVTAEVSVPRDTHAGSYYFVVNATSSANPNVYALLNMTVVVPAMYNVQFTIQQGSNIISAEPEENRMVILRLNNRGNAPDTIDLGHDLSEDWIAGFENTEGENITSVHLQPFSNTLLNFVFNATMNVEADEIVALLSATSRGNPSQLDIEEIVIQLSQVYGVQLTGVQTSRTFDPEDETPVVFSFQLENTGNGMQLMSLSYRLFDRNGEVSQAEKSDWITEFQHNSMAIASTTDVEMGSMKNLTMEVTPPSGKRAGDYRIELTAIVSGTSFSDTLDLNLNIVRYYNMTMQMDRDVVKLDSGVSERVTLTVSNDGNDAETVQIAVQAGAGGGSTEWFSLNPSTVVIQPGDRASVTIRITVPEDTPTGTYVFTVRTNTTGTTPLTETITLEVTGPRGLFFGLTLFEMLIIGLVLLVVLALAFGARGRRKRKIAGPPLQEGPKNESTPPPPDARMSM